MMLKIKGSVREGRSKCLKLIFFIWVKCFCFVLHGCPILIDQKQQHKICFDEILLCLSCGLCDTHMLLFSLMNVLIKRLLFAYFDKKVNKLIVSVFSSTYFWFATSSLWVESERLTIFWLFISLSPISPSGLLGSIQKTHFFTSFFQNQWIP